MNTTRRRIVIMFDPTSGQPVDPSTLPNEVRAAMGIDGESINGGLIGDFIEGVRRSRLPLPSFTVHSDGTKMLCNGEEGDEPIDISDDVTCETFEALATARMLAEQAEMELQQLQLNYAWEASQRGRGNAIDCINFDAMAEPDEEALFAQNRALGEAWERAEMLRNNYFALCGTVYDLAMTERRSAEDQRKALIRRHEWQQFIWNTDKAFLVWLMGHYPHVFANPNEQLPKMVSYRAEFDAHTRAENAHEAELRTAASKKRPPRRPAMKASPKKVAEKKPTKKAPAKKAAPVKKAAAKKK